MDKLLEIIRSNSRGNEVLFRKEKYGEKKLQGFLCDVMAMANAAADGPRYIVVGVEVDEQGKRTLHPVDKNDFAGNPHYRALAKEHIEPQFRLRYKAVSVDGKRLGVFEISDTQDRPYMMRNDFSETLKRGDAYLCHRGQVVKMGRPQLSRLFAEKFRDTGGDAAVEVGFPGDDVPKELSLKCYDLSELPSTLASRKIQELIDIQANSSQSGATTVLIRMTHARLFGADQDYVDYSIEELQQEIEQIRASHWDEDSQFLYGDRGDEVQVVVRNQGETELVDASMTLVLPNNPAFHIAERLPRIKTAKGFVDRTVDEATSYPAVNARDDSIRVGVVVGNVPVGETVNAFDMLLRVCAGNELDGKRFGIRYSLKARNLQSPLNGQLKFIFNS